MEQTPIQSGKPNLSVGARSGVTVTVTDCVAM
jgi:hypothetical protein